MISDALTRLSGTRTVVSGVVTETPQDLGAALAATPTLSENYIDLSDRANPLRGCSLSDGQLFAVFSLNEEQMVSAGNSDATVRFQLITTPRTVATGQTFTVDAADDTVVCPGDYLPNGTLVTASSDTTLPAGLAAATHYYVYRDDTAAILAAPLTTFKLSLSPDGVDRASPDVSQVANITSAGTGTHTILHIPQVVADSAEISLQRLRISNIHPVTPNSGAKADQVMIRANPLPTARPPLHRYMFARYIVSHNLGAGKVFCDVGIGVPDNVGISHASGFEIA